MLCLLMACTQVFAQTIPKGELNFTFATGTNVILEPQLDGAGSYNGEGFYGIGLSYLKPLNNWLSMETGLAYTNYTVSVTPGFYPGREMATRTSSLALLSVPITARANFWKYLFVQAGVVADFETKSSFVDDQSGIGFIAGVGLKYSFSPKVSAFVNPFLQQHAVIAFRAQNYQQSMLDAGVRLGIGLTL